MRYRDFDICLFAQMFIEILLWQFMAIPYPSIAWKVMVYPSGAKGDANQIAVLNC